MRLKPMSLNGLMNFAMVTGIDVTPYLYYYVAKIRIISQTSIIRQHLFGLLLLAIDKNSNKNFLSAKKESFCDISRIEMNHLFYRIVHQYPFWCKLSDTGVPDGWYWSIS